MFQAQDLHSCPNSETLDSDGLHSCSSCNVLHYALFQNAAETVEITETNKIPALSESTMSNIEKPEDASDILKIHPTADDMEIEIVQPESEETSVTMTSTDANGHMSPAESAAPSLVITDQKTIRDMKAQIEEIHQVLITEGKKNRETERQLSQCQRELMTLKRRRVDSAGGYEPTSVTFRSSNSTSRSRSRAPLPEARMGDMDEERRFLITLPARGPGLADQPETLKNPAFFYPWRKQGTKSPLQRARTVPKLQKQGIDSEILEAMSSNALMEWTCLISALLYHCGSNPELPDWVPEEYLRCPLLLALEKLESLSPAAYYCMLRKPNFLTQDRLGIASSFYCTPQILPRGDIPLTVMMSARGRYAGFRFGKRNVVEKIRNMREQQAVHMTPEAPTVPLLDQQNQQDLRSLLTPKKPDLRANLGRKIIPAPPRKETRLVMVTPDPNYIGPHTYSGTELQDIRQRSKVEAARLKEQEAKAALEKESEARRDAEREEAARVVERQMRELTRYRDALMRNSSSSPKGEHRTVPRSRKRSRSSTPPSRQASPSASRSPPSSSRQRGNTRLGKGKDKRHSFSRSPSHRKQHGEHRPHAVTVPGLSLGPSVERRSRRTREFSKSKSPPRAPSRSPSRSPSWHTSHRRSGRR